MTAILPKSSDRASNHILLPSIRWETYRAIADDLESQPSKRLTYDNGLLEIRMPSDLHENYKKILGRIVEALTETLGMEILSLGSMTCDREDLARGLEPDQCYYIQNEAKVWGKDKIDLQLDPPPDLAIEIDITSSSLNRFSIYAQLGVPEVWRYDGQVITIHYLVGAHYSLNDYSIAFPLLRTSDLQNFLELKSTLKENALIQQVRQWAISTHV
ncbi:Uma2 family endonuclease [Pseudanabaena sp. BC1403]|uniref:Uma2 family endonuclease n=1 Tax=Pseudanabaena sp. BC1403 TaxID=2043171 RepID=UPI000CD83EC9|nr:Uma2 family endonuclease [Pseudanabaena sp. BC1403]